MVRTSLENLDRPQQDTILDFLKRDVGMKAVAQLRLVCKAWKNCVTQYPGAIVCGPTLAALTQACLIMPTMANICIRVEDREQIDLSPLSQCRLLTFISLSMSKDGHPQYTNPLDLGSLPASVASIHIHGLHFTASTFQNLPPAKAAAVTELSCSLWDVNRRAGWDWLGYLPNLQVLHAGQSNFYWPMVYDEMFERGLGRLSSLTSLGLTDGKLCNSVPSQLHCPSTIHNLQLTNVAIRQPWMASAFKFLPNLTHLAIHNCTTEGNYPGQRGGLGPVSSLRKFSHKNSAAAFLNLIDKSLESLDFHIGQPLDRHLLQSIIWRLGGLKSLTHLELCNVFGPIGSQLKRLQTLPNLLELRLFYCQNTPFHVFKPGSFPSLRSLYLEDDLFSVQASKDAGEGGGSSRESFDRELAECSSIIFNHPNLVQASGYSALFEAGIKDALMTWSFSIRDSGVKREGFEFFYQAFRRV